MSVQISMVEELTKYIHRDERKTKKKLLQLVADANQSNNKVLLDARVKAYQKYMADLAQKCRERKEEADTVDERFKSLY